MSRIPVFFDEFIGQVGWLVRKIPSSLGDSLPFSLQVAYHDENVVDPDEKGLLHTTFVTLRSGEVSLGTERVQCFFIKTKDLGKLFNCDDFVACGLEQGVFNEIDVS